MILDVRLSLHRKAGCRPYKAISAAAVGMQPIARPLMEIHVASLRPKNWANFQHYKDRSPAWIKLHRGILDDFDYSCLPLASKALAPLLWLLASEHQDGEFTDDPLRISHRLRWLESEVVEGLKPLIDKGFFEVASGVLAECYQGACLEERRGETEKRERRDIVQPPAARSRFDDFWSLYPEKKGKQPARKAWDRKRLDPLADEIIAHVRMMISEDDDWKRGYAPHGSTYINSERWTDEPKRARLAQTQQPSKRMQGIMTLEAMKNGLDSAGSGNGAAKAFLPRLGEGAGGRFPPGNGDGMG